MTEHPIEHDDDSVLAAEYALGVLQGPARDEFARRMAADPGLAADVRAWNEHFASFAREIAPIAPPAAVQSQIERRLFGREPQPSIWSSLAFWRGLALASIASVLAIGVWTIVNRLPSEQPALVAEVEGNAIELVAYYDADRGELRLNRTAGKAGANRSLELWLIIGTDAPVSLGVLPADPTARVAVPEKFRSKLKGSVLAISDEPVGGSPTGAATGAVLGIGKLTGV